MKQVCEQPELGIEMPKCEPPKIRTPKAKAEPMSGGIGIVCLDRMDFAALRNECGDCQDENGVSLWSILESLRGYGVKEVNLF